MLYSPFPGMATGDIVAEDQSLSSSGEWNAEYLNAAFRKEISKLSLYNYIYSRQRAMSESYIVSIKMLLPGDELLFNQRAISDVCIVGICSHEPTTSTLPMLSPRAGHRFRPRHANSPCYFHFQDLETSEDH